MLCSPSRPDGIVAFFLGLLLYAVCTTKSTKECNLGTDETCVRSDNFRLEDSADFELMRGISTLEQSIGLSDTVFYLGLFDDHMLCQ